MRICNICTGKVLSKYLHLNFHYHFIYMYSLASSPGLCFSFLFPSRSPACKEKERPGDEAIIIQVSLALSLALPGIYPLCLHQHDQHIVTN